ncbi:HlyD family type I secretion periplasmic adaptor subunit [Betaproteobacteria bacterium SCN2]|jgi:HlyD family secretion protein|nr:HlyD family type I secretion periplasmic adaptor subunit [Betaproteobacteria bacterium SCN2]
MKSPLNKWFTRAEAKVLDFAPPLLRIQEEPPNPMSRKVLWAVLILIGGLVLWSFLGRLDIVAVAEGKLIPQSYVKIVQPAEAGIVKDILVKEGEQVKAGQVLMKMDAVLTEADANTLQADFWRKRLTLQRIDAEIADAPFRADPEAAPALAREIEAQYRANRAALEAAVAEERSHLLKARQDLAAAEQVRSKLADTLPHYREQEKAFEKLAKDGFAGPLMASDKRRERIEKEQELRTQEYVIESARASMAQSEKTLAQIKSDYRRQLYAERNEVANALDRLAQEITKQAHRRDLLELKAPQDGVVKDLATHTVGTVVQPGTVLLTLVPRNETLRAEVWVSNEDIGFVREGQPVKLKFAAYPFQKYGMAVGKVAHVSADAADNSANNQTRDVDKRDRAARLLYKAIVTIDSMALEMNGNRYPLSAGMQTNAEIRLGTRTVAEYLLSPIQKAWHEAGRER